MFDFMKVYEQRVSAEKCLVCSVTPSLNSSRVMVPKLGSVCIPPTHTPPLPPLHLLWEDLGCL